MFTKVSTITRFTKHCHKFTLASFIAWWSAQCRHCLNDKPGLVENKDMPMNICIKSDAFVLIICLKILFEQGQKDEDQYQRQRISDLFWLRLVFPTTSTTRHLHLLQTIHDMMTVSTFEFFCRGSLQFQIDFLDFHKKILNEIDLFTTPIFLKIHFLSV